MITTPHWPIPLGKKPIDLGLERMAALLRALGNPHEKLPPVVHVAGTNGKGSCVAYMRAMLEAAGLTVHVYTSPHLVSFNERIVLAGKPIEDAFLHEVLEECRLASEKHTIPVTFFEGTTAAAFLAFSKVKADVVLLEVGLGGRLDATNVVAKPLVTVITPVSMDHMDYLGNSLEKIAGEKAAIMKPSVPCVVGPQDKRAGKVIEAFAARVQAPLSRFGHEWNVEEQGQGGFTFKGQKQISLPAPALPGRHQVLNAATAVAAIQRMKGFAVPDAALAEGTGSALWPARLQRLTEGRLPALMKDGELWLDGGHNEAAGQMLAEYAKEHWRDRKLYLICGMLKTKDSQAFLHPFRHRCERLIAVPIPGEPNGQNPIALKNVAQKLGIEAETATSVEEAVRRIQRSDPARYRTLITGSLYLAGTVLAANG
jgi:dihydrofolate synthase/folylpolyglutamate synthase